MVVSNRIELNCKISTISHSPTILFENSYNPIPTDIARFNESILSLCLILIISPNFKISSGRPAPSLPKTRVYNSQL